MGEARRAALRVDFDRSIELEFHGAKVGSDGGLSTHRELDEALRLTAMATEAMTDLRTGDNQGAESVSWMIGRSGTGHLGNVG